MNLRAALLLAITLSATQSEAKLTITEVMQSNIDNLYIDNEFPDSWVEIYNDSTKSFRLYNYRIGTSSKFDEATPISGSSVARANGYCVIYCDKTTQPQHANMRIDSSKSKLYLFSPQGEILQTISLPAQLAPNVAYGIDDNGDWGFELTPTPGEKNSGGISKTLLPQPVFKDDSFTSCDAAKSVTVFVSIPDGVPADTRLCVTDDGSEPTISDAAATGRFLKRYDSSCVIRAKLISSEAISQPSTCKSYILHPRKSQLPIISITTDPRYLYDSSMGLFAGENYKEDWRRPIQVHYFPAKASAPSIDQLGEFRVHGGWTRVAAQKSLAIYSNKRFGTKKFKEKFWNDKPDVKKVKSFVMRNGGNNFDGARINDIFAQKLFGTHFTNLDWQAYRQAICYINGTYKGIYSIRERSNEDYVEANYDGLEDIDMVENWNEIKAGDDVKYRELVALYNSNPTYQQMCDAIDVDNFTKMFIAQSWAANTDFPGNNMIMWRERSDSAKWRWLLKDMDFTSYNSSSKVYFSTILRTHNHANDSDEGNRPEAVKIFQVMCGFPQFVDAFAEKFMICLGDFLRPSVTKPLIEGMRDEISDEYPYHLQAYGNPNTYDNWLTQIDALAYWAKERTEKMPQIIASYFNLGELIPVTIHTHGHATTFNGTDLSQDDFIGKFLQNKTISLASADDVLWKVTTKLNNGTTESHISDSNSVSIATESGIASLTVEAIDNSGIGDITADSKDALQITVFGNSIFVESSATISDLNIYSLDGKIIRHISSPAPQDAIELPSGFYLIAAKMGDGTHCTQKTAIK